MHSYVNRLNEIGISVYCVFSMDWLMEVGLFFFFFGKSVVDLLISG